MLGEGTNSMLHAGFGAMAEFRDVVGIEYDPGGTFAYIAGTTGGQKSPRTAAISRRPRTFMNGREASSICRLRIDRRTRSWCSTEAMHKTRVSCRNSIDTRPRIATQSRMPPG